MIQLFIQTQLLHSQKQNSVLMERLHDNHKNTKKCKISPLDYPNIHPRDNDQRALTNEPIMSPFSQ